MGKQVLRWTRKQKQNLLLGIGAYGLEWLCRKSGDRSQDAIYSQIRRLYGGGGLTRGSCTLSKICADTGYNREQIIRAGKALGQRWARTGKRGAYLVTEDQVEQLVAWLKQDYWCSKLRLYGCVRCGTVTQPPCGFGACQRCYYVLRRRAHRLGLPFIAQKLSERVIQAKEAYEGDDREFLELMEARLAHGWAPLDEDLDRIAGLTNLRAFLKVEALEAR